MVCGPKHVTNKTLKVVYDCAFVGELNSKNFNNKKHTTYQLNSGCFPKMKGRGGNERKEQSNKR